MPGQEIVSFRCVRAGEAKLRERVRDDAFSSLVARMARCAAAGPVALDFATTVCDDSLQGFKKNVAFWKTVSRVVRKLLSFLMTVSRVLRFQKHSLLTVSRVLRKR